MVAFREFYFRVFGRFYSFFAFLKNIFAFSREVICFCEFYFREKGQIREIRENISTRKLVHLKYH